MSEFFKGWRRKAGLVTLALALLLTVGWMRSLVVWDRLLISPETETVHEFISDQGLIGWEYSTSPSYAKLKLAFADWESGSSRYDSLFVYLDSPSDESFVWRWDCGPFCLGEVTADISDYPYCFFVVTYSALILPLTLLSAWLILAKPRKPKAATGSTP